MVFFWLLFFPQKAKKSKFLLKVVLLVFFLAQVKSVANAELYLFFFPKKKSKTDKLKLVSLGQIYYQQSPKAEGNAEDGAEIYFFLEQEMRHKH